MGTNMQTILGGGGAIGKELARELLNYTESIRIASRNPTAVNTNDQLMSADLNNADAVMNAVAGSDTVYLVAGIPYKLKIWKEQWPRIMQNVIDACRQHKSKLVFFDNIYLYDAKELGHLTESSAINPPSKKGEVRARIAQMILDEVKKGTLTAMIVRSADFYGPAISNSMLLDTVYKNLKKGKPAYWMGNRAKIHSFTFTPDAAAATALLGNTPDAYNQVWHLPTSDEKLSGDEWVHLFAGKMGVKERVSVISKGMVKFLGIFNPLMRELPEMMYQNENDYFFDSAKFKKRFPEFPVTSYDDGVTRVIAADF